MVDGQLAAHSDSMKPNSKQAKSHRSTEPMTNQMDRDKKIRPKTMVFEGNRYYLQNDNQRGSVWNCSTSRYTNCTGRLKIDCTGKNIRASGLHDHASNI